MIVGSLDTLNQVLPPLVCFEPAVITLRPYAVTVESSTRETSHVTSRDVHTEIGASSMCAYVMLADFSNEILAIPKAIVLGVAEGISESWVERVITGGQCSSNLPTQPRRISKNAALYHKPLGEC
jgi:hypothetical protein